MSDTQDQIERLERAYLAIMDHAYSNEATYLSLRKIITRHARDVLGNEKVNEFRRSLRDRVSTRNDCINLRGGLDRAD